MNIKRNAVFAVFAVLLLVNVPFAAAAKSSLQVADVFGSRMVLQRDVAVPVWGIASPGEKVTVTLADQEITTTADRHGRWSVKLDAMRGSNEPHTLAVTSGDESVIFDDVLVGEVWLVLSHGLGMQYTCEGPVPNAACRVRSFGNRRVESSPTPQVAFGKNAAWGPGHRASAFDLLSTPFANRLNDTLGVPVGIVRAEIGELDATIPVEGYAAVESLRDIAETAARWDPSTRQGKAAYAAWLKAIKTWKREMDAKLAAGEHVEPTQPPLVPGPTLNDPTQPTVVFNRVVHPLTPFAFRGALHIHDEPPHDDPSCSDDARYADKIRALAAGLRAVFQRPELAFAFTQRNEPTMYHHHTAGGMLKFDAWMGHRDRQRRAVDGTDMGMIVTLDIENHLGKVGLRAANWALVEAYDRKGAKSGPLYTGHRVQGDRVIVEFDHTDGGLMAAGFTTLGHPLKKQDDKRLRFFAVAGEDRVFHSADAQIDGNKVVVRSDKVAKPVAVRYACDFDPRGMNLYNGAGLPASPFRSDDWPIGDFEQTVEQYRGLDTDDLLAKLVPPSMLHSHAAAKAVAMEGEKTTLPLAGRLLNSDDPDHRCAALRMLGYLYFMGPVDKKYYGTPPQEVTAEIARAIGQIETGSKDADPVVRRCAAEALSLIGADNEQVFEIIKRLAIDDDPLVRTAALRMSKYRLKTHAHNTGIAYALLQEKPFADATSTCLAAGLLSHYRIEGEIDCKAVGRVLENFEPGQGGGAIPNLGDLLRRLRTPAGVPMLNHADCLPGVLHVYSLGYRNYMLYGVERWIGLKENIPVYREKIEQLEKEIEALNRTKPPGWRDLSARYADAAEGLRTFIEQIESKKK